MKFKKGKFSALLAIGLAGLTSGCNIEEAQVTKKAPSTVPTTSKKESSTSSASPQTSAPSSMVYFSTISTNFKKAPANVNGIGFLAGNATTTQSFTYHFENRDLPYNAKVFLSFSDGIFYGWQSGPGESTLSHFEFKNRNVYEVSSFSKSRIVMLTGSQNGESIGWIDEKGHAWIYEQKSNRSIPIQSKIESVATNIQITNSNTVLLSSVSNNFPRFSVVSGPDYASTLVEIDGADASLNPDGDKVVYEKTSNSKQALMIYDITNKTAAAAGVEGEELHSPQWKNDHEITFLSRSSNGLKSLRLFNLSSGQETMIASLHVSDSIFENRFITCPSWDGDNKVYFADYQSAGFSIFRATLKEDHWEVSQFARSFDENTGYICPQVVPGGR